MRFQGVAFTPSRPGDGKYQDTLLAGIRLTVTDRSRYDPIATAVRLISIIRNHHREQFAWIPAHFDRLAGTKALRIAIDAGTDADEIVASWRPELTRFEARRKPYLLYPAD